jgi:hypothetical protein
MKVLINFFFFGDARVYSRLSKNSYFVGKGPALVVENLKNKYWKSFYEFVCN